MKLFQCLVLTTLLGGTKAGDDDGERRVPDRHPLQRLHRLVQFSHELLEMWFSQEEIGFKPEVFLAWKDKFQNNAGRMRDAFVRGTKKCGFYNPTLSDIHGGPMTEGYENLAVETTQELNETGKEETPYNPDSDSYQNMTGNSNNGNSHLRDRRGLFDSDGDDVDDDKYLSGFFDRYDRQNPCLGVRQVTTGFRKWATRYIGNCDGQRLKRHQEIRMNKWYVVLQARLGTCSPNAKFSPYNAKNEMKGDCGTPPYHDEDIQDAVYWECTNRAFAYSECEKKCTPDYYLIKDDPDRDVYYRCSVNKQSNETIFTTSEWILGNDDNSGYCSANPEGNVDIGSVRGIGQCFAPLPQHKRDHEDRMEWKCSNGVEPGSTCVKTCKEGYYLRTVEPFDVEYICEYGQWTNQHNFRNNGWCERSRCTNPINADGEFDCKDAHGQSVVYETLLNQRRISVGTKCSISCPNGFQPNNSLDALVQETTCHCGFNEHTWNSMCGWSHEFDYDSVNFRSCR